MPRTYSFNPKETKTIDAPVRRFAVDQGSVVVSKHDEVIATTVVAGEDFACNDRGGLVLFSPDSATLNILFTEEAELGETGRHAGESERRGRKRRSKPARKRKAVAAKKPARAKKKAAPRGDTGGGSSGGFESRTVGQLRAEAAKRKIPGRSKLDKDGLIEALRG